jgi:hypothetical protein
MSYGNESGQNYLLTILVMTLDCVDGLGTVNCIAGIDMDAKTLYGVVLADWKESSYTSVAETQLAIIDAMTPTSRGDQARHRKWFRCGLQKAVERAEDPRRHQRSVTWYETGWPEIGTSSSKIARSMVGTRRPIRSFTVHPTNILTGRTLIRTRS